MVTRFFYLLLLALLCIAPSLSAQVTVHFTNPWPDEPERADSLKVAYYTASAGYKEYPVVSEGSGMYSHTFTGQSTTSDQTFSIKSYSSSGNKDITDLNIKNLFDSDEVATDVYLYYNSQGSDPEISLNPLNSKVIYLLSPWPENSPKAVVKGSSKAIQMRTHDLKDQNDNFCGWYSFYYNGEPSNCVLHFVDYPEKQKYLTGGINSGDDYDLSSYLKDHDTVWIRPNPYPYGPGAISSSYPNKRGDCGFRNISAHVLDYKSDGTTFFTGNKLNQHVVHGIVQSNLGPNDKPVKSANTPSEATGVETVNTWFSANQPDTCVQLKLSKQLNGNWVFNSDKNGGFFPIDNFNPFNEVFTENGVSHNFHFSMELHAGFVYKQGTKQQFIFRGDDDVWIFVNKKLAIDLGNLHWAGFANSTDTINLDQEAGSLGLQDGAKYQIDMFYMERQPFGSNFYMNTSLDLYNEERLLITQDTITKNPIKIEYKAKMWEKKSADGSCGINLFSDSIVDAKVTCTISGPHWPSGEKKPLSPGLNYKGITIPSSGFSVIIDSAKVDTLIFGEYTITFTSTKNPELQEIIQFQVGGRIPVVITANPPDGTHFIGDTTITLTASKDAKIYYTTNGKTPDTNDASQLYTVPFTVQKTTTVQVTAIGNIYLAKSDTLIYTRDAEKIVLTANPPSGTHFSDNVKIAITASNNARIYYTLGSDVDTNDAKQLYKEAFTTNKSIVVTARAVGPYLIPETQSWVYTFDPPVAKLEATPGDLTHFGDSLIITLSTDADSIVYTINGLPPNTGSEEKKYNNSPFTIKRFPGNDTVIVKATAKGNRFTSTSKHWTYISDKVSGISANPTSRSFAESISVTLVSDLNAVIYYTTDGVDPTTNSSRYSGALQISATTQLKARAFANNKVPSEILTENYTRNSVPGEAFYYDNNADGNIDSFSVKLDYKAAANPDSLVLQAYGSSVTKVLRSNQLTLSQDKLSVSAKFEPALSTVKKTNDAGNGHFGGPLFDKRSFNVQDKVAPVLQSAVFEPKLLEENMTDFGTLKVKFSEPVSSISFKKPFLFYQNGSQYSLELKLISQSNDEATFSVIKAEGIDFPRSGDLMNIATSDNVKDLFSNGQNNLNNVKIPLKVLPQPFTIKFQLGPNPFTPNVEGLHENATDSTRENLKNPPGVKIVADFRADLKTDVGKVKAKISIYDALGNLICTANRKDKQNKILQLNIDTNGKTRVFFVWSGHNQSGRKVGSGTYFANITITDPSGVTISKQLPIGVKN